ncbi:MAG: cytochrome c oxidase subunit II [Streptosporangiaceae bacterium]
MTEAAQTAGAAQREPRHGWRISIIWLIASAIADPLIWFVWGPHMPPGDMSSSASGQQFDVNVMALIAAPVMLGVLIYGAYALVVWRVKDGDEEDGPPIHGNAKLQVSWIAVTTVLVLFLFGFGWYELAVPAGAGSGEGPSPIWSLHGGTTLQVQVIGQQWMFTYRYPQFGGFESPQIELPVGDNIEFHVTSLDVIHSFWAYQLGVKADANPDVDNVAFTKPKQTGPFTVRCDELCGLWHGAMFDYGRVVSATAFQSWAHSMQTHLADVTKMLPPYATTYDPTVIPTINKAMAKAGITGANGYYYPPQDPVQP